MSKGKKGVDGIDKVIDLFPAGSHKMIERLLAKAAERDARQAGRNVRAAMRGLSGGGGRSRGGLVGGLATNLAKALRQRGDVGGGKASIRQKAPDTGGRPFHFAHSVISKEDAAPGASGKAAASAKGATPASGGTTGFGKTGRAAAHMRYIEREIAVECTYGQGHEEIDRRAEGPVAERDGGQERGEGRDGAVVEGQVHATSATAGQGYIENPIKLANGEQVVFSFGTIGDRFEDRVRFWEALEEAEAHPSARVQHRLIVELPHEASPQARYEMMRTFTKRFEDDGVPYWAALHAPGKGNDSRNFHAHIVYSERPAKMMVDPDAPNAPARWDFAITKTYRKKSRNVVTTRPFRQEKLRSYNARDFVKTIRKEFSDTVNGVLARDDVRDGKGQKVLYDARSYKSMGVDAVPMRSINRIVADKMKEGQLTVLDGDYTRRMITAELRDAAAKRQKGVMDLIALDSVLRATATTARPQEQNGKLPRDLRVSPWINPGKAALRAAGRKIMEARHAALQIDVMERATTASLERIIAATTPKAIDAAARARDPVMRAEAASPDAARMLHAAALDELAETRASTAKARMSVAYRVGNAVNEWKALVQAKPPEISPAVKAAIQQMDRREERAESAARDPRGTSTEKTTARGAERATEVRAKGPPTRVGPTTRDGGRLDERVAEPTRVRNVSPRAQATTGRPGVAPVVRPSSMEDALRVRRPPTVPELEAASRAVSGLVRAVTEGEDDVNVRIRKVEALVDAMKADVRRRQGRPPLEGDALVPTSMRLDEPATPVVRSASGVTAAVEPAIAVTALRDALVGIAAEAPAVPPAATSEAAVRRVAAPETAHGTDQDSTVAGAPTAEWRTTTTGGIGAGAAPETPEGSDDARRRKKREEEIEKRKRQRRAVLGRRQRGRGR